MRIKIKRDKGVSDMEKTLLKGKLLDGVKKYFKRNAGILIGLLIICIVISIKL